MIDLQSHQAPPQGFSRAKCVIKCAAVYLAGQGDCEEHDRWSPWFQSSLGCLGGQSSSAGELVQQ